jgi:hypothetical protein
MTDVMLAVLHLATGRAYFFAIWILIVIVLALAASRRSQQ